MLVDIHAHLDLYGEKEIEEVVERAESSGVKIIVTNGLDSSTNRKTLEIQKRFSIVKAALGIYPVDALKREKEDMRLGRHAEFDIDEELKFIESRKSEIAALGEVGLDFVHGRSISQESLFIKFIALSNKIGRPLIVHSRKAEEAAINILEAEKAKQVVLHCFNGKISLVERAVKLGFSFSIPCTINRSEHFQHLVKRIPLSRILTETDAPFLSPYPERKNEPAFVSFTVKKIAELKGLDKEEAKKNIFMNYQRMFNGD